ncbi:nucleotidyl transferase AbiEii/AbiGii toxin family protein [Arhodomonas aquaeolei]|uniref:nucleotidyl transferase AbiEii/AbiGii toxin family protein n=1 Tax=Arhodomonas aquaeolei TaxID=2369 RepID=UPI000A041644|nr:nucleotidyl transferase AbiEii/AbiGii toxin family protein [Arhodomonas aquaeolei]
MSDIFLSLSPGSDSRLPPLEAMSEAAADEALEFMVVGATARDLVLHRGFGIRAIRATQDVDVGVHVASWNDYEKLVDNLLGRGWKRRQERRYHRLHYTEHQWIDIAPFGGIARPDGTIAWPPDGNEVMSTLGFSEAFRHALLFELPSGYLCPVASLPSQALLKIAAWLDRKAASDASDLAFLMETYADADNLGRLYEGESPVAEQYDYEVSLAAIHLLGMDIRRTASTQAIGGVLDSLRQALETPDASALIIASTGHLADPADIDQAVKRFEALVRGMSHQ